jgi:hypothetical protein
LDGDADLIDRGNGYLEELDAAPEVLEDFQSDDDFTAEEGIFNYADSNWAVSSDSWTSYGPDSGQDREVVMSGQRLYQEEQTAYLTAGTYTLEMTDSYGDGWNGNTIYFNDQNGATVDSATLGWGQYGESDIVIPTDGFYSTEWSAGSWQGEVYFVLKAPDYPDYSGGGFQPDALPFSSGATQGIVKSLGAGTYFVTMTDSFGDGWNGNVLTVYDDAGNSVFSDYLENYCVGTPGWGGSINYYNCYSTTVGLTIPSDGEYTFILGGGSWQGEVSFTVAADQVAVAAPAEYFMQTNPVGQDGSVQTTTCINANDYNQLFISFGYHVYGTPSQNSGLILEVRAADDRDGNAGADFFNGQWTPVWEERGDVDPGAFN